MACAESIQRLNKVSRGEEALGLTESSAFRSRDGDCSASCFQCRLHPNCFGLNKG